jgi:hypothetical protein
MKLIDSVAARLLVAVSLGGLGCGASRGGPAAIKDFPDKMLVVRYDEGTGLVATLDYSDTARCDLLNRDAFARLNGRSVTFFPGSLVTTPPQSDDGAVFCTHPSVTLPPFSSDLPPPWTIEIGDPTDVLAATFGPGPINPFTVGPVTTSVLTSSVDNLIVQIQRPAGAATAAFARATSTSSDGQSCVSVGAVGQSNIVFGNAILPGWPPGPIKVQIEVDFYAVDILLSCQAPKCSLVPETGICSQLASVPGMPGPGIPCGDLLISSTRSTFSIQLICQSGACS